MKEYQLTFLIFNLMYKHINMKIERAKLFLRESTYNITQISDVLGYSGIHYFSRQFKKITGMTPTEYSNSIKAMM